SLRDRRVLRVRVDQRGLWHPYSRGDGSRGSSRVLGGVGAAGGRRRRRALLRSDERARDRGGPDRAARGPRSGGAPGRSWPPARGAVHLGGDGARDPRKLRPGLGALAADGGARRRCDGAPGPAVTASRSRELEPPGADAAPTSGAGSDVLDTPAAGGMVVRGSALRFGSYVGVVALSVVSAAVLTRHLGSVRFGQYTTVISLAAVI